MIKKECYEKNHDCFKQLVSLYNERLMKVISQFTFTTEHTEDIAQEVWMIAYRKIHQFHKKSQFFTWLYRIAINTTINFLKKNKSSTTQLFDTPDNRQTYEPEEELKKKQIRLQIGNAIQHLKKHQREVFLLRQYDNQSYKEISDALGISVNNAKTSYFYAIEKMRKYLKEIEL